MTGDEKFFFDNTYYLPTEENTSAVVADTPIFSAVIEKDGFFGIQFMPEKSGEVGLNVLQNFLSFF